MPDRQESSEAVAAEQIGWIFTNMSMDIGQCWSLQFSGKSVLRYKDLLLEG